MWKVIFSVIGAAALVAGGIAVAQASADARRASAIEVQTQLASDKLIPFRVRQWAQIAAVVAVDTLPRGWAPIAWARVILAVMDRESQGGALLAPRGPAGYGDPAPRALSKVPPELRRDTIPVAKNAAGEVTVVPPDGGWGRGLMQVDWASHDFARTGDWRDPLANVRYGARLLSNLVEAWGARPESARAGHDPIVLALASYNAGQRAVAWALGKGRTPDSVTTGDDYSSDVLRREGAWASRGAIPLGPMVA